MEFKTAYYSHHFSCVFTSQNIILCDSTVHSCSSCNNVPKNALHSPGIDDMRHSRRRLQMSQRKTAGLSHQPVLVAESLNEPRNGLGLASSGTCQWNGCNSTDVSIWVVKEIQQCLNNSSTAEFTCNTEKNTQQITCKLKLKTVLKP